MSSIKKIKESLVKQLKSKNADVEHFLSWLMITTGIGRKNEPK